MLDETQRLSEARELFDLLDHYARLGVEDRESWQDRLTAVEGVSVKELVRLYGELLAYGWLEQNTGLTPILVPGRMAGCYRITSAGLRAVRHCSWN